MYSVYGIEERTICADIEAENPEEAERLFGARKWEDTPEVISIVSTWPSHSELNQ
jgi:hypothetical protein